MSMSRSPSGLKPLEYQQEWRTLEEAYNFVVDQTSSKKALKLEYEFYAILGFFPLYEQLFMLVVRDRKKVGYVNGQAVYTITDTKLIEITDKSTMKLRGSAAKYKALFKDVDLTQDFFYSHHYDLTQTVQKNFKDHRSFVKTMSGTGRESVEIDMNTAAGKHPFNEMYMWNYYLATSFLALVPNSSHWLVPLVHGYFFQTSMFLFSSSSSSLSHSRLMSCLSLGVHFFPHADSCFFHFF